MQRHVLRGGVHDHKRLDLVQVAVVPRRDDRVEHPVQLVEVHDDADGVELIGGNGDGHAPVVPVQRLEGAVVQPKLMRGCKLAGGRDFEGHLRVPEGLATAVGIRHDGTRL